MESIMVKFNYGNLNIISMQGFSKVDARSDYSRLRRSEGEEGAGGGRSPPPAPSSPERLLGLA